MSKQALPAASVDSSAGAATDYLGCFVSFAPDSSWIPIISNHCVMLSPSVTFFFINFYLFLLNNSFVFPSLLLLLHLFSFSQLAMYILANYT